MFVEWIVHEGTSILDIDMRDAENGLTYDTLMPRVLERMQEKNGRFLILYNFQNVIFQAGVLERIASFAKAYCINPEMAAFVGMSKTNQSLLKRLNGFLSDKTERRLFESEDEAKEWLTH
jgi:hypothetical protein